MANGSAGVGMSGCLNRRRQAKPGHRLLASLGRRQRRQFKATAPQSGSETAIPPKASRPPRSVAPPSTSCLCYYLGSSATIQEEEKKGLAHNGYHSKPPSPSPTQPSESAVWMPAPYASLPSRLSFLVSRPTADDGEPSLGVRFLSSL